MPAAQAGGLQHRIGPVAQGDIEPQCPRRIGLVGDIVAGEQQPQIILGQQNLRRAPENVAFVLRHPQQLGRGEAGHCQVAGDLARLGDTPLQFAALLARAHVIPQDGWPQHLIVCIEQHRAVHLAGKADTLDASQFTRKCRAYFAHGRLGGLPPVRRMLFRPHRLRPVQGQRAAPGGDDALLVVDEQDFGFRRAEIDAEIHVCLLLPSPCH